ncbi:hypothetical protein FBF91_08200 [Campylobacter upsaliensis]|uniref:hypothetical protein n=1 Tax=Campylobacter upsaliensis TaxID=28080 RepID=UPI0012C3DB3A|nr:hypothetical protein [Campylobacter upsaliensis]EAK7296977.1 hypothetical protein [Campylobacter upsaliensis]MBJ6809612.1 hypothetical protein [Campylobacter upsaliensis]
MVSERDIKLAYFCIKNTIGTYGALTNQAKSWVKVWSSEVLEDKLSLESYREDLDSLLKSLKSNFRNNRYFYFKKFDFEKSALAIEDKGLRDRVLQVCKIAEAYKTEKKVYVNKKSLEKGKQ